MVNFLSKRERLQFTAAGQALLATAADVSSTWRGLGSAPSPDHPKHDSYIQLAAPTKGDPPKGAPKEPQTRGSASWCLVGCPLVAF